MCLSNAMKVRGCVRCWAVFLPSEHLIRRLLYGDEAGQGIRYLTLF